MRFYGLVDKISTKRFDPKNELLKPYHALSDLSSPSVCWHTTRK